MPRRLSSSMLFILCFSNMIYSQNNLPKIHPPETKTIENSISLNYLQINEGMNYGLIFKGPGLAYDFSAKWENKNRIIDYTFRFGLDYLETKEIAAANINVVPVKFTWLFRTSDQSNFFIGPQLLAEYNYQLYPDLQSGYSFWFTHFSLGVSSMYKFNLEKSIFKLSLESTLLGFTSHQEVYDDPYFFDLSPAYVMQFVHQDLKFGSLKNYNRTEFQIRWQSKPESRLAFAYDLQYYGYYQEPDFTMVNQMVKIIFLPKIPVKFQ